MRTMLLAIDNHALPFHRDLCLYMTRPSVRAEAVLRPERDNPDAPDNAAAHFYGSVLHDGGIFRMWYYACHWEERPNAAELLDGNLATGPICYAESDDGLAWRKPALRQVEWRGSAANNVIRAGNLNNEGVHVIRDDDDPDPARRFKMLYNAWAEARGFWTVRTAVSPDGFHWVDGPELPYDAFFEQASLYRFGGYYFANGQIHGYSEGGAPCGRQGYAIISPDFDAWLPACGESFLLPEPADPALRGATKPYDQVHLGVGAAVFGNVLVGLFCRWHNEPFPTERDWFGKGTTSGDFGLLVSSDGLHFREPVQGYTFLHRDESRPAVPAGVAYRNVLCQGNGILNVGEETRIYHGRWANAANMSDYYAEVGLATLPRDRWGALGLPHEVDSGAAWTAPVTLPAGATLALNADGARGLRVEVTDERFSPLPGFSGLNAGTIATDGLESQVLWKDRSLEALAGQTVRFCVSLQRSEGVEPRLYALYVG